MFKALLRFIAMLGCSLVLLISAQAQALDLNYVEPENCYVIAVVSNKIGDMGGDAVSSVVLADISHNINPFGQTETKPSFNVLPIPIWLLFFGLWLIGFKLTSQPSPCLNRSATSR